MSTDIFERIADGRTDLVFDHLAAGHAPTSTDKDGVSLLQWCSYHGDVSAIKFLVAPWTIARIFGQLLRPQHGRFSDIRVYCQYLIEQGADVNKPPAFGTEATIQMLLDAGARIDTKDMDGDSPLGWASWYLRLRPILRKLCYGEFHAWSHLSAYSCAVDELTVLESNPREASLSRVVIWNHRRPKHPRDDLREAVSFNVLYDSLRQCKVAWTSGSLLAIIGRRRGNATHR